MSNVKDMRIFAAEQIIVPDEFPKILKDYTKEVVRKGVSGEADIVKFSLAYFEQLLRDRAESGAQYEDRPSKQQSGSNQMVFRKNGESPHDHYYISGMVGHPFDSKARLAVHKQTGVERTIKEVPKS